MCDLIKAGLKFKAYLASWHAWINEKLGGDLEKIRLAAKHFMHSWIACGVDKKKVEFIFADDAYRDPDYWAKVVLIAKRLTVARVRRTLEIMGRRAPEAKKVADFMYTPMQVADIFHFGIDICQLGMDQRKANVVAREIGPGLGFWKPVCVHHHLLAGLVKPQRLGFVENARLDLAISSKMSKSKPWTCIFIYDSPADIKSKIMRAWCPAKETGWNPVLEIAKYIIFRERDEFIVKRAAKYGGPAEFHSYEELESSFRKGALHPQDLKSAVAAELTEILKPVRRYFRKNKEAKKGLEVVSKIAIKY
jgi:tyrosyl-tRNA synthetase